MKVGRRRRWFKSSCPGCGKTLSGVATVDYHDAPPQQGDFSVCLYCACVSVFDAEGRLRLPDVLEAMIAARDSAVQAAIRAVQELNATRRSKQ